MATPLYSGLITDLTAVPAVKHDPFDFGGHVREVSGTLTLTSAQVGAAVAGDIWTIVRVPTRARMSGVFLTSDALAGSTLAVNLGVYTPATAAGPGTAVSAALYLSAATTFLAAVKGVDQSLSITAANQLLPLWQLAGAAKDPGGFYDIAFTITTAATTPAAGSINLTVDYVDND